MALYSKKSLWDILYKAPIFFSFVVISNVDCLFYTTTHYIACVPARFSCDHCDT